MSETNETEGMTAVWVCGYCTRPFRDVPHKAGQQATTPPHDLPWWGRACRGAGHPARLAVVTQAEDGSVRLEPTRWVGEPGKAPWQGAISAENAGAKPPTTPSDKLAEAEKRIEALEETTKALGVFVGRQAEEIAVLKERTRVSDEMRGALTERVKALEGGPKAEARAGQEARYRVVTESGGKAMIEGWLRDLKMMDLPAWLERSDDNGRTWKRCTENDNAK